MGKTYHAVEYEPGKFEVFSKVKFHLAKVKGKVVALASGVTAFAVSTVSHAAIDFGTAKTSILADIDSAEDFGVEIGLAILGFIAVVAVLRHVRGAVK